MTFMPWSDELSVGLGDVDEQHQWLVTLTNRLHDELGRADQNRAAVSAVLDELMNYTMNHFIMEEEMFQRFGYPQASQHKALHDAFTQQVLRTITDFEGGADVGRQVLDMLKNWLVHHIMVEDKAYVPFLTAHGVR